MQVKDAMTPTVHAVSASTSLAEAARIMKRLDIGFLPIVDDQLVGVITDRDIAIRGVADGRDPNRTTVAEIATTGHETIIDSEDLAAAAKLMEKQQIRRLIVCDSIGAYVGVLSLGDLAAHGHELKLSGEALEQVCSSGSPA